jgi:hypothetical protein
VAFRFDLRNPPWGPQRAWGLDESEERTVRRLFEGLESYRVELDRKAAVLFAVEDGVDIVAWNRRGTRALASGLPLPDFLDMRSALLEAVSGGSSGG